MYTIMGCHVNQAYSQIHFIRNTSFVSAITMQSIKIFHVSRVIKCLQQKETNTLQKSDSLIYYSLMHIKHSTN